MEREVKVGPMLGANLEIPDTPIGVVLFAHGSGSSRHSERNRAVAATLRDSGFATLLADLLTSQEEAVDGITRQYRFDVQLLGRRTVGAIRWITTRSELARLPLGLFGSSTGAAAALIAAADEPRHVRAVVSRGGRPDLADGALVRVRAPTLLIVGGEDADVLALNRRAAARLHCAHELVVIPGATHLFEEPGALGQVADHAATWFRENLHPVMPA